jgi:hypothetical protein
MTRREIKQDKLLVWTSRASMYMEERLVPIVAGVAAVILVVVSVYIYRGWDEGQSERGTYRLAELEALVRADQTDEAIALADVLIDEFAGRPDRLARLYKADALRAKGDFGQAKELYEAWSGTDEDEVHGFHAVRGLADCLSAEREYREAGDMLASWANDHTKSPLAPYALVDAASNFELANDFSAARDALQKVVDDYSNGQIASQARRRLRLMDGAAIAEGG